jgi:protein phosphatase PTC7
MHADTYEARLRDGDLVMLFTDGLADNVFPEELAQLCALVSRTGVSEAEQVQAIADRAVEYAQLCMWKENRPSPFERECVSFGSMEEC